ncbi:hypothetical protein KCMC57_64790 (plasmid) [Kitasatospora sp. CMC57]|uniref:Uncharacterized protein n=1 Tax=Kitasatospora sp. CMC57 TaxID=3231513 RepID=A0AB33K889_9ACTN
MAHRKHWTGRIFSAGYRGARIPTITTPTVGIRVEVTDGPQVGRMVDINLTPEQARSWAESLLTYASQVEDHIARSAITRVAAEFEAASNRIS